MTVMTKTTGSAAFLRLLVDEGVSHLFGNPGTTELPIMAALPEVPELRYVLGLQEAVVVAMADGYARASGRLAAANVHVAPGLGNAIGALYSANFFGSPLIVAAGQQEQGHGLLEPILSGPLVDMARPLVKWAVEAPRTEDLPRIVRRAAKVALAPPTGPVFISLPGDVLSAERELDLGRRVRVDASNRPSDAALDRLASMLLEARDPALVVGQEISARDAFSEAAELAELLGAAVFQQTLPSTAPFPSEHRAYLGPLGRMQQHIRSALTPFDLIVCLGADLLRVSIHSEIEPLPEGKRVVHVSERSWELGKNYPTDLAILADVREALRALLPVLRARIGGAYASGAEARLARLESRNWSRQREKATTEAMRTERQSPIDPRFLALAVCDALPADGVLVEEAATTMGPLLAFHRMRDRSSFFGLASGGLGFGLPGAVGISIALPGRPVAAVIGDGSAMYGVQALWTAAHLRLPVTYVIVNNRSYRILKERVARRSGPEAFVGMDLRDPPIDFVSLGRSFGLPASSITDPQALDPALRQAFSSGAPSLIDVQVADGFGG
jgi:benzoylformate decarboxylase